VLAQIDPIWNPRKIYIGGGNTKHLAITLPKHVKLTPNVAGLLGGIALWEDDVPAKSAKPKIAKPKIAEPTTAPPTNGAATQ
jgi:hypothetical protein